MPPSPSPHGACAFWALCLSALLLQDGIEHLHDEALLRLGQCADAFELLLQLRCRPALACAALGRRADEFLDADVERLGQQRQCRDRHPALSALVGGDGLLRDAEGLGELDLGDATRLAQCGEAFAEGDEKAAFFFADRHGVGCWCVVLVHTVALGCRRVG